MFVLSDAECILMDVGRGRGGTGRPAAAPSSMIAPARTAQKGMESRIGGREIITRMMGCTHTPSHPLEPTCTQHAATHPERT